jgi:glucosamine--fructose-6-phosphate aminotransferase (isomerizing)
MRESHATLREIREQPAAVEAVLDELDRRRDELRDLPTSATFALVGCGSSYYLAHAGAALLNRTDRAFASPGGEVLLSPEQFPNQSVDVVVPVSRSGESTETVRATTELRETHGASSVVGITCGEASSIHDRSDVPVCSPLGSEESVVMTKSFSSMLVALEYLALLRRDDAATKSLATRPDDCEESVERAASLAEELGTQTGFEKFVFLGSGGLYGVAAEAMLKMEEMTLSWTKAYHPLEFRHGPRSIADENTLVTLFVPEADDLYADLVADIRSQGTTVAAIGPRAAIDGLDADHTLCLPDRDTPSLALYAPFFQLLGYYAAVDRGLDPDDPQNLTQVVEL